MGAGAVITTIASIILVPAVLVAYTWIGEKLVKIGYRPRRAQKMDSVRSYIWILPALLIIGFYLVYPVINTIIISFQGPKGEHFVGLKNYIYVFSTADMLMVLRNNLFWLILPFLTTAIGVVMAVLIDRVRYEKTASSLLFLPMAISYVAAGVIWKFMYQYKPPGEPQTGTLNALLVSVFPHFQPLAWTVNSPGNNFALIAVGLWMWTGFCMVILSASLKGIPADLLSAARIDGANEWQVFWRIIIPLISSTIVVVLTTMIINVLKIFDIVYVMTAGNYQTNVIANELYKQLFIYQNNGRSATLATILFIAVIPVVVMNIRKFVSQK